MGQKLICKEINLGGSHPNLKEKQFKVEIHVFSFLIKNSHKPFPLAFSFDL